MLEVLLIQKVYLLREALLSLISPGTLVVLATNVLKTHKVISTYRLAIKMGRIDIILPDDLEQRFREKVFKKFGMKKGNITLAIKEAIERWIKEVKTE